MKKISFLLTALWCALSSAGQSSVAVTNLLVNHRVNPLGIDDPHPRFSWQLLSSKRNVVQKAYEISIQKDGHEIWNGHAQSDQSLYIRYAGPQLKSEQRYLWKVRIIDQNGQRTAWSRPAFFETGFFDSPLSQAVWIGKDLNPAPPHQPAVGQWIGIDSAGQNMVYFKKEFEVANKKVVSAIYKSCSNDCELIRLNGQRVGTIPFWQPMRGLQYHLYNFTDSIRPGKNELMVAILLQGKEPASHFPPATQSGFEIRYEDGTTETILSDSSWQMAVSPVAGWQWDVPADLRYGAPAIFPAEKFGNIKQPFQQLQSIIVRNTYTIDKPVKKATVSVTGLGGYYLYVNGRQAGADRMAPGWTTYYKTLQYQTYDVTPLLKKGNNDIRGLLGNLWWSGDVGWRGMAQFSEGPLRMLLQMRVQFTDGSTEVVTTDKQWKASRSPITFNSIYDGESYDARLEDSLQWVPVDTFARGPEKLLAEQVEPIRITQSVRPVSIRERAKGVYLVDLGQNIAGVARLKVKAARGTRITLRFAEILNPDGSLKLEPLRTAKATDVYIARGTGTEVWQPMFTYHGFQYIEVKGYPGKLTADDITGLVTHSNVGRTGIFVSSDSLLNRLHRNINWTLRANFMSVMTDCPQRDERMGWTGDGQIIAATAGFNFDMHNMFAKFMRDIRESQLPDGDVLNVNPNAYGEGAAGPGWADALIIIPWKSYLLTGDKMILEDNYPAMQRWHLKKVSESRNDLLERGGFGDWVSVDKSPDEPIGSAYYYYSTSLLSKIAATLGRPADAAYYDSIAARTAIAFNKRHLNDTLLSYTGGTQTANLLPIAFGITPENERAGVAASIVKNVHDRNVHISTGFLGTQYILPVLSDYGYHDLAFQLSRQETYPSWGYMIRKGASSMWELWNSDQEGPGMNSRNHYAYGTVDEWLYRYLGGIRYEESAPGFKHIVLRPQPVKGLHAASAATETPYGRLSCRWQISNGTCQVWATIPANTTADLYLPDGSVKKIGSGDYQFTSSWPASPKVP